MTAVPQIVCAGCGEITSVSKPICDACAGELTDQRVCMLCDVGMLKDENGLHINNDGGYAGKCSL